MPSKILRCIPLSANTVQRSIEEMSYDVGKTLTSELHLFYLADLYSKFNEVQKRLQGKNASFILARTIIHGYQAKIELFKSSLECNDLKNFLTYE